MYMFRSASICKFRFMNEQNLKKLSLKVFYFCNFFLNFENPRIFFYEIREQNSISNKFSKITKFFMKSANFLFVFVLKCTQREHVP